MTYPDTIQQAILMLANVLHELSRELATVEGKEAEDVVNITTAKWNLEELADYLREWPDRYNLP